MDSDAAVAQAKMKNIPWRRPSAIRYADRDDNPATTRDPFCEPVMPTPNHPEYLYVSGLYSALLAPETGRRQIEVASDSAPLPIDVTFEDWTAFLDATSQARIHGGMRFRFSNEEGPNFGRRVGLPT